MPPEQELIKRLARLQTDAAGLIRVTVRDRDTAQSLCREVASTLARELDQADPNVSAAAWARGITIGKIQAALRESGSPCLSAEALEAIGRAVEAIGAWPPGRRSALRSCLTRLPDESSRVLSYRYEQRQSVAAMAEEAGRRVDEVVRALSRARDRLDRCVCGQLSVIEARRPVLPRKEE